MLGNLYQGLARIFHRTYRQAKPVARASLAVLMTLAMLISSVGISPSRAVAAPVGAGFNLNAADLRFIMTQIKIAEAHVAVPGYACEALLGPGPLQVPSPVLPFGLRSVDGSCNNLQPGQGDFGRADELFPRMLTPDFRLAENVAFDPDGPGGQAPGDSTSYTQTSQAVFDSQPRTVSNLVVDQTSSNPAAVAAAGPGAVPDPSGTLFIPNVAPDVGLSAPFNSVFTFFGQFFDHGLDLVTKGGNGIVFMPLQPDDPLFDPLSPTNFMVLTRATMFGDHESMNTTTPFVDQNQTYTSHPSHQVFLRAYTGNPPLPTGKLIDGALGNIGNWAEVKAQAATLLGLQLVDTDVLNVPLLATDPYGHFIPGPLRGMPQYVTATGLVEGDPAANLGLGIPVPVDGFRTGHAFLDDIAHSAGPGSAASPKTPDADLVAGGSLDPVAPGEYDNELLDRHFITGDGRGNENIGLTAIHTVFHSEHNRLRDDIDAQIHALLTATEITEWEANNPASGWGYGERLFQASRFVTEMEYQHLVFEEFARKVQPQVNVFSGYHTEINPAIAAEFAHTVYRFGHSMLDEEVARTAADEVTTNNIDLFAAFLNPVEFNNDGSGPGTLTASQAVGQVIRGSSRQVGNEIDEFVTDVLRNRLVGLPLDLPSINMARGRSEGIPSLNSARRQFYNATGNSILAPYESWSDLSLNLKHSETLFNLVAAYGTHPIITGLDPDGAGPIVAGSLEARRMAADQLIMLTTLPGPDGIVGDNPLTLCVGPNDPVGCDESADDIPAPTDSVDFMLSIGFWTHAPGSATTTGVDNIDFWVGGLAEKQAPFGGLLGSTFNFVFETQLENLQDGDRFYYLFRLAGQNLLVQLEGNSFAELIMRNSDVEGLPADVFSRPDFIFRVANLGAIGPILNDPTTEWNETALLTRNIPTSGTIRFAGPEHVVFNGVDVDLGVTIDDRIFSSEGDDTIRGNGGNDWMEGGAGNDQFVGGLGDDIINDAFGDDVLKGGDGDDALSSGQGFDLNQGGRGKDFIVGGSDPTETFGGPDDDMIFAGDSFDEVFGDDGDDWIEGGNQADLLQGDNGFPFQNDPNGGHDVIIGGGGNDDYDSEGGDDIMVTGPGIERNEGMLGFDWVTHRGDPQAGNADMNLIGLLPPDVNDIRDRFDLVEGLSGWNFNDTLRGDNGDALTMIGHELDAAGIARITGLADLLPFGATSFTGGNIILGGAGSDLIEGRGGDDIIDGDRWLNVQLSTGALFVDSMTSLRTAVFAGTLDPGTITIIRSIVTPLEDCSDSLPINCGIDTALFSGPQSEYTITFNGDGSVTVNHLAGLGADGVDTLWNMEQARFCDVPGVDPGTCDVLSAPVSLTPPVPGNTPASGTVTISNPAPSENELLTATPAIVDPDGIGPITLTWEAETAPAVWTPVGTGATFTPGNAQVGQALRVVATFTDLAPVPVLETVISAPTAPVLNVNDVPVGVPTLNPASALPQEGELVTADASLITDADGLGTLNFQWQQRGGGGFADIPGATSATFTPTQAEVGRRLRVAVSFTDLHGTLETLFSAETGVVGDVFVGTAAAETFNGTAGRDNASGGGGNDSLTMAGADDIVSGDGGNDTISAGAGNDVIRFTNGTGGFDAVTGGAGTDEIQAMSNNTVIGLVSLTGVETINGGAFTNVTILGSSAANTLNFSAVTLTNIAFIDGGGGNDTITGSAAADTLLGGAGADTINGGGGDDNIAGGNGNDTMNGQGGLDTFWFSAGFGADRIIGFDANPAGGQDKLNISALGITAANFAANVTITSAGGGADTLITIGGATIRLVGVTPANVTIADFVLAP